MFKLTKKLPVGIAALCVVSVFGLKDTGVFVNEHVQTTYSGNKIAFAQGEKVEILEKTDNGYIVAKGKAKVTIPEEKISVSGTNDVYKVIKNTAVKNNNDVIRNLFIGEELDLLEDKGEGIVVKCKNDGVVGYVPKDSVELIFTAKTQEPKKVEAKKADTKKEDVVKVLDKEEDEIAKAANTKNVVVVNNKKEESSDSKNVPASANKAIDSALNKLGSPYVWGSTGDGGYDCSGLVYSVYKDELGVNLPRTSKDQSNYGTSLSKSELRKGDLVFFNTFGNGVSHVGIYMGEGKFVHASYSQKKVVVSDLNENYYTKTFVKGTRILK